MPPKPKTKPRGPKPGQGGRNPGPPRLTVSARPLEATVAWLRATYPGMTDGKAATLALDSLSGANGLALARAGAENSTEETDSQYGNKH